MNFVQQLEECLRDLAAEARKKHPGVKEASERATLKLRTLQNSYIAALRQANKQAAEHGKALAPPPTTALFQSSEILHPFLLAANYPNASYRLLEISFKAMRLLMEGDAIVYTDAIHMVRVWMIQAQVVAQYYHKQYAKELQRNFLSEDKTTGTSSSSTSEAAIDATTLAAATPPAAPSSSSSWFSWGTSVSTPATSASAANSTTSSSSHHATTLKNNAGVSSSSGQSGSSSKPQSPKQMDAMAKEILSCLLQLMQLIPEPSTDLWMNATALGSMWLAVLPTKHTVHEAARSTVLQMMHQRFTPLHTDNSQRQSLRGSKTDESFDTATWDDLLVLAALSSSSNPTKSLAALSGSFALCKRTSWTSSSGAVAAGASSFPPTSEFALELMTNIWKERHVSFFQTTNKTNNSGDDNSEDFADVQLPPLMSDKLLSKTMGVTMSLLTGINKRQQQSATTSVELTLRIVQWALAFITTQASLYPNECTELFLQLIKPIAYATEACRTHHDFEDGYVFSKEDSDELLVPIAEEKANSTGSGANGGTATGSEGRRRMVKGVDQLASLVPAPVLWKAGLSLEATLAILERRNLLAILAGHNKGGASESRGFPSSTMVAISETLSDFATIGASCREHMLQVVDFAESQPAIDTEVFDTSSFHSSSMSNTKPTLFRRAEQVVASGKVSLFVEDSSTASGTTDKGSTVTPQSSVRHATSVLGEALWVALQGILRIADCINSFENAVPVLEETFAPSLAVLQHYLKRFVGSRHLVQLALNGYANLAMVCCSHDGSSLQRKALLTSLSKLSLPSWGKHDASSQLQDHHVRALLQLCRIVHSHYDSISSEWDIILWTFEELADLSIASTQLSDESYYAALAVSTVLGRFAAFSTCFSTKSLLSVAEALTEIAKSTTINRDIVGDSDTVLQQRTTASTGPQDPSSDGKETISEKIMNIGVRAIYGGSGESDGSVEASMVERTKNSYYEDYRRDFVQRLSSSQSKVRVSSIGKLPLSLAFLTDVIMANSFRFEQCGDDFSSLLSGLASSSLVIRPFVMDVMSMLTMANVSKDRALPAPFVGPGRLVFADPMQSQLWAVESIKSSDKTFKGDKTQSQLLEPICQTLRTTEKADVAESALGALNSILEGVGHNLNGEVWSDVINAVGSLSGDPLYELDRSSSAWSSCCLNAFRCLKFIVDDFLEQLASTSEFATAARNSLLDCCSAFGRSRHDINTSLTAIGLLWTIADQDAGEDSIDRTLSKLVLLASDARQEVRNASVNTLFSCIVGRGGRFSASRWESCFHDSIFGVYDLVANQAGTGTNEAEKASNNKSSSRYQVSLHHSRDSVDKQWVATQVLVLRGLVRVLRNYFSQLLETTDTGDSGDVPWFQDAWVRILDFAFDAASQTGGRDTLDIRSVGVELLCVSCQLSSKAGINAAAQPARVSTSMEVVNGALRSVREASSSKTAFERSHSMATELSRRNLFLEAFEGLESFKEFIENQAKEEPSSVDDSFLMILHKLGTGLTSLYECCKDNELSSLSADRVLLLLEENSNSQGGSEEELERRFVAIATATLQAASLDPKSRFLNQTQRCLISLLRLMGSNGSTEAFKQLVELGGSAFFVQREAENDDSEAFDIEDQPAINLVSAEAVSAVSTDVVAEGVRDICKALVLYQVLLLFTTEAQDASSSSQRQYRHYKTIIPIILSGLEALARVDNAGGLDRIVELVWHSFLSSLSVMLTPVPLSRNRLKISQVPRLLEVVGAAKRFVPSSFRGELCTILSFGASKAFELALSVRPGPEDPQRDNLVRLFDTCFAGSCALQPEDSLLLSITQQVLSEAQRVGSNEVDEDDCEFRFRIAQNACRAISENERMETLVVASFTSLCQLATSESASLRGAVAAVFESSNIGAVLQTAQERCTNAERRAEDAERQVESLSNAIRKLQEKNESLRREVAILEASSAM